MSKLRFRYSKLDSSKFISHLDLTATLQRAFLRAGIELKYSEGFNPHPFLSVALPLSVGFGSVCELVDVGIIGEKLPDINLISLPDGIKLLDVYMPTRKFSEIKWIKVQGDLQYDREISQDFLSELSSVYEKSNIIISKRSKRGIKEIDIAPHVKDVDFALKNSNTITLTAKISAQEPTLNVNDLLTALDNSLKPDYSDVNRIELFDANMVQFK